MTAVSVTTEYEYCYVETREWLDAAADGDVSDYWLKLVDRIAPNCPDHEHYDGSGYATRCARDRIVAALRKRDDWNYRSSGEPLDGHTSNYDTNFYDNFGYATAPYRGDWLIFVSFGDYHDSGLDRVYLVSSTDSYDTLEVMSPRVGYRCDQGHEEWGDTSDGGYNFETDDGQTRRDVIADGQATCSQGHPVTLAAWAD